MVKGLFSSIGVLFILEKSFMQIVDRTTKELFEHNTSKSAENVVTT